MYEEYLREGMIATIKSRPAVQEFANRAKALRQPQELRICVHSGEAEDEDKVHFLSQL